MDHERTGILRRMLEIIAIMSIILAVIVVTRKTPYPLQCVEVCGEGNVAKIDGEKQICECK